MIFILIILAAICVSIMDVSSEDKFIKSWMNKNESWGNKWMNGNPEEGEKFFGSSTFLVWTTDLWHFAKMIFNNCWQIAVALQFNKFWIYFILIKVIFAIIFELTYKFLKNGTRN